MSYPRRVRGFSFIELLIILTVIGILMSIAIPNYQQHRIKANRVAAQAALLDIASRQRQYFIDARRFFDHNQFSAMGYSVPDEVLNFYTVTVDTTTPAGQPPRFVAKATPHGVQAADGELSVDYLGKKLRGTAEW
jgi:type IV pilus assembly protein PilE